MRYEDLPTDGLTELKLGDKVTFDEEKRPYTVRAVVPGGRFYVLTKPFNAQRTVLYSVIDREGRCRNGTAGDPVWGVRGPDDSWGTGYETEEEIAASAALLAEGRVRVSMRYRIRTEIVRVRRPVSSAALKVAAS